METLFGLLPVCLTLFVIYYILKPSKPVDERSLMSSPALARDESGECTGTRESEEEYLARMRADDFSHHHGHHHSGGCHATDDD